MNKYYPGERTHTHIKPKGKGKLSLIHGNGEQVITIYAMKEWNT